MRRDKRLAYQGKIQALLIEWGSQIDGWQEWARADTKELFGELNHKRQTVRSTLAAMKSENDDRWLNLRSSVDSTVEDMLQAMNKARERFR